MFDMLEDGSPLKCRLSGIRVNDLHRERISRILREPVRGTLYLDPVDKVHALLRQVTEDVNAVIDVGAFFLGYDTALLAQTYSSAWDRPVLFWQGTSSYLSSSGSDPTAYPVNTGIVPPNVVVLFDQAHMTGIDLKLRETASAIVTVDMNTNYRDLGQGVFRMRGLERGQTIGYATTLDRAVYPAPSFIVDLTLYNLEKMEDQKRSRGISHCARAYMKNLDPRNWVVSTRGDDQPHDGFTKEIDEALAWRRRRSTPESCTSVSVRVAVSVTKSVQKTTRLDVAQYTANVPQRRFMDRLFLQQMCQESTLDAFLSHENHVPNPSEAMEYPFDHQVALVPLRDRKLFGDNRFFQERGVLRHVDTPLFSYVVDLRCAWTVAMRCGGGWRIDLRGDGDPVLEMLMLFPRRSARRLAERLVKGSDPAKALHWEAYMWNGDKPLVSPLEIRIAIASAQLGVASLDTFPHHKTRIHNFFNGEPVLPEVDPDMIEWMRQLQRGMS